MTRDELGSRNRPTPRKATPAHSQGVACIAFLLRLVTRCHRAMPCHAMPPHTRFNQHSWRDTLFRRAGGALSLHTPPSADNLLVHSRVEKTPPPASQHFEAPPHTRPFHHANAESTHLGEQFWAVGPLYQQLRLHDGRQASGLGNCRVLSKVGRVREDRAARGQPRFGIDSDRRSPARGGFRGYVGGNGWGGVRSRGGERAALPVCY